MKESIIPKQNPSNHAQKYVDNIEISRHNNNMESKRKRKKPWKLLGDNNYDDENQKIKHVPLKKKRKTLPLKRHLPSPLTKARILLDYLKKDEKKAHSKTELLSELGMSANSTWRGMIAKLKNEGFITVEKGTNMIELCYDDIIPLYLNKHFPFNNIKTPSPVSDRRPISQFKKKKTPDPVVGGGKPIKHVPFNNIKTPTPVDDIRPINQLKKKKTPDLVGGGKPISNRLLDPRVVEYLKIWFINHFNFPYPTGIDKQRMIADTGLEIKRLDQWFANKRRDIRKIGNKDKSRHWKQGKEASKLLYSRVDADDCDDTISHSSSRTDVQIKAEECESERTFAKVTKTLLVDHNNCNNEDIFCNQSTKRRAMRLNTGNQYTNDCGSSSINNNATATHTQDTISIKKEEGPFSHILADPETWFRKTENLFEELPPIDYNCHISSITVCSGNINSDITVVQPNDVLFARCGQGRKHPGNVQYRSLVKACLKLFSLAERGDKYKIAGFIVCSVRRVGGRFLQRIKKSTINPPTTEVVKEEDPLKLIDMGNIPARDKTYQTLWTQGKKLASIGIGGGNKNNSDDNRSNTSSNSKFVYRAVEGPQPIYGYALDLISLVCNYGDDITGGSGSVVQKRDGVILHSYHKYQPHRVLDKPLFGYKPETEPEKERLMRLQVNNFVAINIICLPSLSKPDML